MRSATTVQLVGDDLFVTNVKFLQGIDQARQTLDLDQGQPDRHALLRRLMHRIPKEQHDCSLASAWVRLKIRSSPISPSPPTPARSRPAAFAVLTASQSTISCCGSKKTWATRQNIRAVRPFISLRDGTYVFSKRRPTFESGSRKITPNSLSNGSGFTRSHPAKPSITWPESVDEALLFRLDRRIA